MHEKSKAIQQYSPEIEIVSKNSQKWVDWFYSVRDKLSF